MRVTLSRCGGFAGILPPPVTIDTATLPGAEARRIAEWVASADFFNLPSSLTAPARQPDRLQYTICVLDDNDRTHTVVCDEEAAPAELLNLVRLVQKAARR
jgi:hypothetical protein